ncbi:MAG: phosphoribosylaminoimidazolesuccinocarboxamide synthase [Candidatus Saccharimonadales bacterium]
MDNHSLRQTNFSFPGQSAMYGGKVRDVYSIGDNLLVMIATDRISAFDVILPRTIPYKGQVLNQLAAQLLDESSHIVPNWLMAVPDPNVSIGLRAEPLRIELVIRGYLVGHAWREYKAGKRTISGADLPDGLREYDEFSEPIITPTTKALSGHDEDINETEILTRRLCTKEEWDQLKVYMRELFTHGQKMAGERGLILADTKYEFGRLNNKLILIDEIHTPDSSRYFYRDSYDKFISKRAKDKDVEIFERPKQLSKEFVREWLMERGFSGQTGESLPTIDDEFVNEVSERYIELYEKLSGKSFKKSPSDDMLGRIEKNVIEYLESSSL